MPDGKAGKVWVASSLEQEIRGALSKLGPAIMLALSVHAKDFLTSKITFVLPVA